MVRIPVPTGPAITTPETPSCFTYHTFFSSAQPLRSRVLHDMRVEVEDMRMPVVQRRRRRAGSNGAHAGSLKHKNGPHDDEDRPHDDGGV